MAQPLHNSTLTAKELERKQHRSLIQQIPWYSADEYTQEEIVYDQNHNKPRHKLTNRASNNKGKITRRKRVQWKPRVTFMRSYEKTRNPFL